MMERIEIYMFVLFLALWFGGCGFLGFCVAEKINLPSTPNNRLCTAIVIMIMGFVGIVESMV